MYQRTPDKDRAFRKLLEKKSLVKTNLLRRQNQRRSLVGEQIQIKWLIDEIQDVCIRTTKPMTLQRHYCIQAKRNRESLADVAR